MRTGLSHQLIRWMIALGALVLSPGVIAVSQLGSTTQATAIDLVDTSHTVPAGTNRLLLVTISHAASLSITDAFFGGVPMTRVIQDDDTTAVDALFALPMGSASTPITGLITYAKAGTNSSRVVITAVNYQNVNQTTPVDSAVSRDASGTNVGSSLTVTSAAGDLVFDILDTFRGDGTALTTTAGASQTVLHGPLGGGLPSNVNHFGSWVTSTEPGAASVTMSWTSNSQAILHLAANINHDGSTLSTSTQHVFFTTGSGAQAADGLHRVNADGTGQITLLQGDTAFTQPESIAIDPVDSHLYLADASTGRRVMRYNLDGSNAQVIHTSLHTGAIRGLALDRVNRHIYFTTGSATPADDRLVRMNYDGTGVTTLAADSANFAQPLGVALDLARGFIYVADANATSGQGLLRFNLDGSNRTQIVSQAALFPSGAGLTGNLDVDQVSGDVYLTLGSAATSDDRLVRITPSPLSITTLAADASAFNQPSGVVFDRANQRLYVGDNHANLTAPTPLLRFNADGSARTLIGQSLNPNSSMYGVALYSTRPTISNIADQTISINTSTGALPVTVGDNETASNNLYLFAHSTNPSLLPLSGLVFGGTGTARTLTATPAAGQSGSALVTVYVSDGGVLNWDQFTLTVNATPNTTVSSINRAGASPSNAGSVTWNVVFANAVSGLGSGNFSLVNGGLGGSPALTSVLPSGAAPTTTWTVTASTGSGSGTLGLNMVNASGLSHTVSNLSFTGQVYTLDRTPPTATLAIADTSLRIGEAPTLQVMFSEAVSGVDAGDFSAQNGTLSALNVVSGTVAEMTFTPDGNVEDTTNVASFQMTGVTDAVGNAEVGSIYSQNYTIDTRRPTATISLGDTALLAGETSSVMIGFSEPVTGFTTADLALTNGALSLLSSGDGGMNWTATLTPTAGVNVASNQIYLNLAGLTDLNLNPGTGLASSPNYSVNTVRPSAVLVLSNADLNLGGSSTLTVTFSPAVSGFDNADLAFSNTLLSPVSSGDGGITWTATLSPTAGVTDASNQIDLALSGVTSLAGNAGVGTASSGNYRVDTVRPTLTITVTDTALSADETSVVTFAFSEAVSGFTNGDITVGNGVLSAVSSGDNITWTATLTPTAGVNAGSNVISVDNSLYVDAFNNPGSGTSNSNNYAVNTVRPSAGVVVAPTSLNIGATATATITFDAAVSGFTTADLIFLNGGLSNLATADAGVTWTVTLTPNSDVEAVSNTLVLDLSGVTNAGGNAGTGTSTSNNFSIDTLRPTLGITVTDSSLGAGETSPVTLLFSEAVNGFDNADLSVPNGVLSAVSSGDGGVTWTATYTPNSGINVAGNLITAAMSGVTDLAGNSGSGSSSSNNFAINTVRPTGTVVVSTTTLAIGATSVVNISFSEQVSGFTVDDLVVANGSLSALTSVDGGQTWTAILSPDPDVESASNVISLDLAGVNNAFGNAGSGTVPSNNFAIDTRRPTVTVTVLDSMISGGETSAVQFAFSEPVTGLANGDLIVPNGNLTAPASGDGGLNWSATFTPTLGVVAPNNVISINLGGISDGVGNAGTGSTDSNNFAIDTQFPTVTQVNSSTADGSYGVGAVILIDVSFSQTVTVAGGTPSLLLETGTLDQAATWVSGSGSTILRFAYTVAAGDVSPDLDYASTSALALNGASIRGAGDVDAVLTLPAPGSASSLGGQASLVIDGVAPTVNSVDIPTSALYVGGQTLNFVVHFSEVVNATGGTPRIALTLDSGTVFAPLIAGSGSADWQFAYTVQAGDADANGIVLAANIDLNGASARDGAGNPASLSLASAPSTAGVRIDARGPQVVSLTPPASGNYDPGQVLELIVNFDENVVVDSSGGVPSIAITLDVGGVVPALYQAGSGSAALRFSMTVQPGQQDLTGISIANTISSNGGSLADAAGNAASLALPGSGTQPGVTLGLRPSIPIPALNAWSLLLAIVLLGLTGLAASRRT